MIDGLLIRNTKGGKAVKTGDAGSHRQGGRRGGRAAVGVPRGHALVSCVCVCARARARAACLRARVLHALSHNGASVVLQAVGPHGRQGLASD